VVGDEVLVEVANRLLGSVRSYDFVGRYGGEEFIVVLNNCNPDFAPSRAEEIRRSISNRPIHTAKGPLDLTMSFGAVLSVEWGLKAAEELLHEADIAMYEAKAAGRNCLRLARPTSSVERSPAREPQSLRLPH
jgi:diguanylate cyclase (GGDEF)-like protein